MDLPMGLYKFMAKIGLSGIMRKSGGLLNTSWQTTMFGDGQLSEASDIWANYNDAQRQAIYRRNALIFACCRLICTSFHSAPLQIGVERGQGDKLVFDPIHNHEVINLLKRPNPMMSQMEFMEYHIAHLLLTGKSFLWEFRDARGKVAEVWPVPSHWVTIQTVGNVAGEAKSGKGDDNRVIAYYVVSPPRCRSFKVPVRDMTYVRFIDPLNFVDGVGPLQACQRDYQTDTKRENYVVEMLENLKVPGMIIRQQEEFTDEDKEEMRAVLAETVGTGKRGSPLFLWGDSAGVEMVAPLKDLDWPGLSAMSESHICAAFGVPPLLVHARVAQQNSPLSAPNLDAAETVFFRTTMLSLWNYSAATLTRGLVHNEGHGEDLILRHDTSGVAALQENQQEAASVVEIGLRSGAMQINEGRERLGLAADPKLEGVYLVPMNMQHYKPGQEELLDNGEDESIGWDDDEEEEGSDIRADEEVDDHVGDTGDDAA